MQIHPEWRPVLETFGERIAELLDLPSALPPRDEVFRALSLGPEQVRVLILGQDPYPTPGHAMGLSFSVAPGVQIPRSLRNIYQELHDDVGITPARTGDLRPWLDQGVMLLNKVLTVGAGDAGSHRGRGWEEITDAILRRLAERGTPLVAILWGKDAQRSAPLLRGRNTKILTSPHPSPLSARRGFFGSRPFSAANEFLVSHGQRPIDWRVEPERAVYPDELPPHQTPPLI